MRPIDEADPTVLRAAYACFPSGVAAICCLVDDEPVGMAVSSFTTVSLDPPLVSACMQRTSSTWPKLRRRIRLGLSVLAEHQQAASASLARKHGDRFADLAWTCSADGALFVDGAVGWFDCSVYAELPAGDHTIALLAIHAFETDPTAAPLVFHGSRYRRLAESGGQW